MLSLVGGVVAGGLVTRAVERAKTRADDEGKCRTAARLVYAELIRNSAPVRYFVAARSLPAHSMAHTAWDAHGEAMARVGRAEDFYVIYNGYAALEAIAFLAANAEQTERYGDAVLPSAIDDLARGIEAAANLAGIGADQLDKELDALRLDEVRPARAGRAGTGIIAGVPSYALVRIGATLDTSAEVISRSGREEATLPGPPARIRIYDARHAENLSDLPVVRSSGEPPTGDPAVDETYDGLEATSRFYWEVMQRNSLDGEGLPLEATVHYGESFNNAFWQGSQLVMGDGDGKLFDRFSRSTDIIAHELTHGVTQFTLGLRYSGQSGALNESISDIFGLLVKQYALGQTAEEADWLIGAEVFAPTAPTASALRSLAHPGTAYDLPDLGKDRQVAHIRDFVKTEADQGGIFVNMGIPNRAFYNVAAALGGFAWEKAGRIWYDTLSDRQLRPNATFRTFANATARAGWRPLWRDQRRARSCRRGLEGSRRHRSTSTRHRFLIERGGAATSCRGHLHPRLHRVASQPPVGTSTRSMG